MARLWTMAKTGIWRLLAGVGALRPLRGLPILAYHSVDDLGTPTSTPVALFRRQMSFLKEQGYRPVTLGQAWAACAAGESLVRPVVLTFDDGTADFRHTVLPILKEQGFVATVFIVPGLVGQRATWKKFADIPDLPLMTWDDLREVHAQGIELQNHSHTHPQLSHLASEAVRADLAQARQALVDRLGSPGDLVACPYGDCSPAVVAAARDAGMRCLIPDRFGRESWPPCDWFALRRLGMDHVRGNQALKMLFFRACLSGTAEWYVAARLRVKRLLRPRPVPVSRTPAARIGASASSGPDHDGSAG